jgi:hypothetical protein
MLRQIVTLAALVLSVASIGNSAIWPEEFFGFKRTDVREQAPGTEPVWEEYGFEEGEVAQYELDGDKFTATAFRFNDATSAMAVFDWQHPVDAVPIDVTEHAVEWDDGMYLAHGNYIFRFDGYKPTEEQIVGQLLIVPMLEQSALPTWVSFVPTEGRVPGSERFIIGPAGLEQFEPRVPPSVAGFHFGVEADIADYETPDGKLRMGVFSYPTPHIARERLTEFRMLPNTVVKRSGSLLAVVFDPSDADAAQRLLGLVNYRATVSWDEYTIQQGPTLSEILITGFVFIGGLLLLAALMGALFGGIRFLRWGRSGVEPDPMILLHIDDK